MRRGSTIAKKLTSENSKEKRQRMRFLFTFPFAKENLFYSPAFRLSLTKNRYIFSPFRCCEKRNKKTRVGKTGHVRKAARPCQKLEASREFSPLLNPSEKRLLWDVLKQMVSKSHSKLPPLRSSRVLAGIPFASPFREIKGRATEPESGYCYSSEKEAFPMVS